MNVQSRLGLKACRNGPPCCDSSRRCIRDCLRTQTPLRARPRPSSSSSVFQKFPEHEDEDEGRERRRGRGRGAWAFFRQALGSGAAKGSGFWLAFLLLVLASTASAEVPTLDYLFPAGGRQGTNLLVTAGGKLTPGPLKVWADDPGLIFSATGTNGQFRAQISEATVPGPHWVRVFNAEGASLPRIFVVGQIPEQNAKQVTESTGDGELIEQLPVTINGRLTPRRGTNTFLIRLEASQLLQATVEAYVLDSPLDAALALFDSGGNKVVSNDNTRGLDPNLSCAILQAGVHRLELTASADASKRGEGFAGSEAAVYRLTLKTDQVEQPIAPATDVTGPAAPIVARFRRVHVPRPVTMASTIHGRINPAGEEDRYTFTARKGERFSFRAKAGSLGSPLAAVLRVQDASGFLQAQPTAALDPELSWVAPADGAHILTITDASGKGGSEYAYVLELGDARPDFAATVGGHTFRVEPGKTVELPVTASRPKFYQGPVNVVVSGLPDGVTTAPAPVSPDSDEVKLTLSAAANAPPANQPFQVVIIATDPTAPQASAARAAVHGQNAAPGELLLNETDQLWLTVLPQAPPLAKP